ncbi:cell wall / vacuolar inhibitor of fructosidase 1-like [Rosa sericea]
MKDSLISIFLVQLVCSLLLLPIGQCSSVFFPMDAKLIDQTCRKTPDYNLCTSVLKSSPDKDLRGLAIVAIDAVGSKATTTMNRINELLKQSPKDTALNHCHDMYNVILNSYVQGARDTLKRGASSHIATSSMSLTPDTAMSCEEAFKGRSPLTNLNKDVENIAAVAGAVAGQLP